jgi:hypothetical protein
MPQTVVPNNTYMTVVSHGTSDKPFSTKIVKRAFRLYERDVYYGTANNDDALQSYRYLQESSLYFSPSSLSQKPATTDDEAIVRAYDATQNWKADYKRPYALALPGTSGAPVFMHMPNTKDVYLFGIINAYAHISGQFNHLDSEMECNSILINPVHAQNNYLTIYSLPYQMVAFSGQNSENRGYIFDTNVAQFLAIANAVAATYPEKIYGKCENESVITRALNWLESLLL